MDRKNRVVIIGSGLGGLECGFVLAKKGFDVAILEHDSHPGGCLRTFRRGNAIFDTGFHYVGGLREGESLHDFFRYFGLLDLPWRQLDEACFDEVVIGDRRFAFATGHDRFVDTLAKEFPHERENLQRYAAFLKQVGVHMLDSFLPREATDFYTTSLFARSAYEFLNETIGDPLLRKVLSGTSLKMELNADTLPLYSFAQINNSYIQSAWRLQGGGSQIAERLVSGIRAMGGVVRTGATVTRMFEEDERIKWVEVNGEERLPVDWVISSAHPASTLALIPDSQCLRRIYRKRIQSLPNTFGLFTANIRLKPDKIPYLNWNLHVHRSDADLWRVDTGQVQSVLVHYACPQPGEQYATGIDMLTPMRWIDVQSWADKPMGKRGEDYVEFKNRRAEECLRLVESQIPGIRDAVDHIYTSTPLSYKHYTLMAEGSAYGIRKDYNNPMGTVLTPRTPIPNLLLTGQNLNLHGILGVSMTSIFTLAELVGMETLVKEFFKAGREGTNPID
ncbi:MAG: NAD(P)/FAD-dependent oxidoreductase [Bacteroidaceae bacterium]|nr:NAD(P)/FAD-dependent oxidoreductase [Bacteroidaceae bacterium]